MEAATEQPVVDAFDAALTSESTYVEPKADAVSRDAELEDTKQTERDDKGRFAAQKAAESKPAEVEVVDTKAAEKAKPRNDPQARIDQIVREREDARRENARLKQELDAARRPAPPQEPAKVVAPARFPRFDEWSAANADKTHDDYLDARDEWRDEQKAGQAREQYEKTTKEQAFSTRASTFGERYAAARDADPDLQSRINTQLLTAKPLSTLTKEDKALISAIPDRAERENFAFLCFLADQWIDSEHAVQLLEHISDPVHFQRLVTLPPDRVIRELARVEAGFTAAPDKESRGPVAKPSASQAHPPIKPLGSAPRVPDADDGADDEPVEKFISRENAKDRKSGRLG